MPADLERRAFILILHADGGRFEAEMKVFATEEDRIEATKNAIFGEEELTDEEKDEFAKYLEEVQEDGWIRFEGDPAIQWVNAHIDPHVINWEYLTR